ncbi:hypothetical protein BaRGS_00015169 [Batillaria attramentaria]|uniref:Uncharacterized protein n=1 Tax=Batillaria attramentaria TaxID=370345 RepID=A0ABD0L2T8_9CAEN
MRTELFSCPPFQALSRRHHGHNTPPLPDSLTVHGVDWPVSQSVTLRLEAGGFVFHSILPACTQSVIGGRRLRQARSAARYTFPTTVDILSEPTVNTVTPPPLTVRYCRVQSFSFSCLPDRLQHTRQFPALLSETADDWQREESSLFLSLIKQLCQFEHEILSTPVTAAARLESVLLLGVSGQAEGPSRRFNRKRKFARPLTPWNKENPFVFCSR